MWRYFRRFKDAAREVGSRQRSARPRTVKGTIVQTSQEAIEPDLDPGQLIRTAAEEVRSIARGGAAMVRDYHLQRLEAYVGMAAASEASIGVLGAGLAEEAEGASPTRPAYKFEDFFK